GKGSRAGNTHGRQHDPAQFMWAMWPDWPRMASRKKGRISRPLLDHNAWMVPDICGFWPFWSFRRNSRLSPVLQYCSWTLLGRNTGSLKATLTLKGAFGSWASRAPRARVLLHMP